MKQWTVSLSTQAEKDLDQTFDYIAFTLLEPNTASKQVSRIRDSVLRLDQFPERCPLVRIEPWQSQGLRYLVIDNYLALYKAILKSKTVSIVTIVYGARNLSDLL